MGKRELLFLLMIWCTGALAQSAPDDPGSVTAETIPESMPKTEADETADEAAERARELERQEEARAREAGQKRQEDYVPSEEISDDLPAPFPVDI